MNYDIPCKHCGQYYGHKNTCVSWILDTGAADKIRYEEFKQRYSKELYDAQKEIQRLREAVKDLAAALETLEDEDNIRTYPIIRKALADHSELLKELKGKK
jgi:hypothetical protein